MMRSKTPQHRTVLWLGTLAEYDFSIEHIKGSQNSAADGLSGIHLNTLAPNSIISKDFKHSIKYPQMLFGLITTLYWTALMNLIFLRRFVIISNIINSLMVYSTAGSDNDQLRMCILNNP